MSGKIEMSLDEIIKQSKGNRQRSGGQKTSTKISATSSRRNVRKLGGGVMRGRGRSGISRNRNNGGSFSRLHLENVKREAFLGSSATGSSRSKYNSDSTKLIVSNLDFGVTDSDILELFSEFGPVKSAGVHYDRSGRSLGSADLIFERRADAIKAMKQYNGVPLDGREMNIQLATSEIPSANNVRKSSIFKRRNSSIRGRGLRNVTSNRRNVPKRGGGKSGGGRQTKKQLTAEELDAELEEYVKSKVNSTEGA